MYENDKQILENDILVLYILNKFDIMITEKSLTDIILTPGLVNYFSFQDSLKKLIENNFVSVFNDNDGTVLYGLSQDGKIALMSLVQALGAPLKNAYDQYVDREIEKIKKETQINAYHFTDINGNCAVRLYIRENGNKIVDLRLPVPDSETALEMCENWKKNAYNMLVNITEIISG